MNSRVLGCLVLLSLCFTVSLRAQNPASGAITAVDPASVGVFALSNSAAGGAPIVTGAVVKDAPYSAEVITISEAVQPSGQKVPSERHGRQYRDAQGRTRTEIGIPNTADGLPAIVTISDPSQQAIITLDPKDKTARVVHLARSASAPDTGTPAAAASPVLPGPANPVSAAATRTPSGAAPSGPTLMAFGAANPPKTETLGTKEMEGMTVTGTRTIFTSAAPAGGEAKPFSSIADRWFSPDLQVVVWNEHTDSRGSHFVQKLVNIVRTEPDAALFQVPPGYTVKERTPQP